MVGCSDGTTPDDEAPAADTSARRDAGRRRDAANEPDESSPDAGAVEDASKDAAARRDAAAGDAGTRDAGQGAVTSDDAGAQDASTPDAGDLASGETGRMVGMTAAHNAVRAMVETSMSLPPMSWSSELAAYAQEWADHLGKAACDLPVHRSMSELNGMNRGENLYVMTAYPKPPNSTPESAVTAWANEVQCYTYGPFMDGDACNMSCTSKMYSDGCGHYTQIVWRKSTQVGCGVSSCVNSKGFDEDIWICNYSPAGNITRVKPY